MYLTTARRGGDTEIAPFDDDVFMCYLGSVPSIARIQTLLAEFVEFSDRCRLAAPLPVTGNRIERDEVTDVKGSSVLRSRTRDIWIKKALGRFFCMRCTG